MLITYILYEISVELYVVIMKIVHIMNWYMPNMGYQENFLPSEQKKLGHDVEIITSNIAPSFMDTVIDRKYEVGIFEDNGIKIHRLPTIEFKWTYDLIIKGLKEKIAELKPDIVQSHGFYYIPTIESILYSKKLGYKLFIDDHSNSIYFNSSTLKRKLYLKSYFFLIRNFYKLYENRVSYWMPVNIDSENILKSKLNIDNNKMSIFPLGANTELFKKSTNLKKIGKKKLGINEDDLLIITTGKLNNQKKIELLIKAFANMHSERTKLLILGSGSTEYIEKIINLVKTLKIKHKVIFKDFVPNNELPLYYNTADIGIWPGSCSITIIEALATGLSIIIPKEELAYKILFENDAAIGFEKGNISSLSKKISKLKNDKEYREYLSQNGLKLVQNSLSWEKIAKDHIDLYQKYL